jgi:hypothetical protein
MLIKNVIIHHSASAPSTTWEQLNEWHKDRDFTKSSLGWYIGYHQVIFPSGEIKKAREDWEIGCHCVPNENKLGICLVGDFTKGVPTDQQLTTLYCLLNEYKTKYSITENDIYGHCVFKATECPGKPVIEWLKSYQRIGWLTAEIRKLQNLLKQREKYTG